MRTFLCLGIVSMFLLSCQSDDDALPTPNERKDIPLSRSEQEMTASGNAFAFKFFETIAENEMSESFFISPLSASLALSMTSNGAEGTTLDEMKATLGFADYSLEEMNAYYKKLIAGLLAADNTTTLGIANSIWIEQNFSVKQPFIDVNKDAYDAQVSKLDFRSQQSVETINQWCSDKTNKRIPKIVDNLDPTIKLILINALYFKGTWVNQFDKNDTAPDDFTTASGQKRKVDMMNQECSTLYTEDEGLQIAELPYGNQAFSMVILLPDEDQNMDNLIDRLTPENWEKWTEQLYGSIVNIKLPKFKQEYERKLNDDLQAMGMNIPFLEGLADFSKIADTDGLYIGTVKQKTFVEVNEEGTEAAAITSVETVATSAEPPRAISFHANRPFIYIIKEKSTGAILFMGKMGNPSSN